MKVFATVFCLVFSTLAGGAIIKRDDGFTSGEPINYQTGRGAPHSGGTNQALDIQNPDGLGRESTDAGTVPNLKWSFSLSKTRIFPGGWTRTQVSQDLPQSHDIAGAQQHLKRGAIRELHWHKAAEWGFVYTGRVIVSAVDENGKYQVDTLGVGDIWYFPKGQAHTIQGVDAENEYLLAFDIANFDDLGVTFNVDDWLAHTPKPVLAKNFGVNATFFDNSPTTNPYITNGTVTTRNVTGPAGALTGNSSYVYHTFQHAPEPAPGNGGTWWRIDSTNFPIAKTIAATYVILKPGGLRELHWHPNAEEWLYFHKGYGRASVFIGANSARTFDIQSGDTAVFPDNSGHYIENLSKTEDLVYIELYKSERVADVSLVQWLALTPSDIVANILKIPVSSVEQLKKQKQVLIA